MNEYSSSRKIYGHSCEENEKVNILKDIEVTAIRLRKSNLPVEGTGRKSDGHVVRRMKEVLRNYAT
jgi:hypothetical protein